MKDKYGREFTDYTCIPRRLLAYIADKRYPFTPKYLLLYDILWNTIKSDWQNMKSGYPISREILKQRLGIKTDKPLDTMLRNLEKYEFIERKKNGERDPNVQVFFLAEPKEEDV